MGINRVCITGNLTRDPETRSTQGGTAILSMGVAVNDRCKDPATGEWGDRPNYVDCVMFGSRAEAVSRRLSKGSKVAIEGKLRYSSWERDGQKRSKIEVVVDDIELMSRGDNGQQGGQGGYAPQGGGYAPAPQRQANRCGSPAPQQAPAPQEAPAAVDVYDEEIPF
ncbi:MAG: single-stranded DNA-binding protein [Coriobacteriaceae bacterium]|nr:single-stranded DNA-binding protein [Coriobacteriaceae bacterium]